MMEFAEANPDVRVASLPFVNTGMNTDATIETSHNPFKSHAWTRQCKSSYKGITTGSVRYLDAHVIGIKAYLEKGNSQPLKLKAVTELPYEEGQRRLLRAQLAALRSMPENWDGMGARPSNPDSLRFASYLIDKWDWAIPVDPEIAPLSDGSVSIEFYTNDDDNLLGALDILWDGDATFALSSASEPERVGAFGVYDDKARSKFFELLKKAKVAGE